MSQPIVFQGRNQYRELPARPRAAAPIVHRPMTHVDIAAMQRVVKRAPVQPARVFAPDPQLMRAFVEARANGHPRSNGAGGGGCRCNQQNGRIARPKALGGRTVRSFSPSEVRGLYVVANGHVRDVIQPTQIDFETLGSKSEAAAAIRDLNRTGTYARFVTPVDIDGSTITIATDNMPDTLRTLGVRIGFTADREKVRRMRIGFTTSGFHGDSLGKVDRAFSDLDLELSSFDIYVPFGSFGLSPQHPFLTVASGTDDDANVVITGVPTAYSDGITVDWLTPQSPALQSFANLIGV